MLVVSDYNVAYVFEEFYIWGISCADTKLFIKISANEMQMTNLRFFRIEKWVFIDNLVIFYQLLTYVIYYIFQWINFDLLILNI